MWRIIGGVRNHLYLASRMQGSRTLGSIGLRLDMIESEAQGCVHWEKGKSGIGWPS